MVWKVRYRKNISVLPRATCSRFDLCRILCSVTLTSLPKRMQWHKSQMGSPLASCSPARSCSSTIRCCSSHPAMAASTSRARTHSFTVFGLEVDKISLLTIDSSTFSPVRTLRIRHASHHYQSCSFSVLDFLNYKH